MARKTNRYDDRRAWYAIHTYAGYEEQVADQIRQRIEGVDMANKIYNVMVPKEKMIVIKNGKRKIVEQKILLTCRLAKWSTSLMVRLRALRVACLK